MFRVLLSYAMMDCEIVDYLHTMQLCLGFVEKFKRDCSWGVEWFIAPWLWFLVCGVLFYAFLHSYGHVLRVFVVIAHMVIKFRAS